MLPKSWTYNFAEDPYGEIDIIEGTNLQSNNIVSLHTCGSCSFQLSGTDPRGDCNLGGIWRLLRRCRHQLVSLAVPCAVQSADLFGC